MWSIQHIEIDNIISFRHETLEVTPDVATLIFGRNEDNASQPCNGSGKSSLIEAISFALTGEPLRKVKSVEEIINDNCDSARVYLNLYNDYFKCTFTICRTISRKSPQVVECHKYDNDNNEIDQHNTVQPSVADYNRYILSEIGLTKDEIYHNYILCDNKYESFFDTSDKGKKEIINNFSNGALVDESIERIQADMVPVTCNVRTWEDRLNTLNGSISGLRYSLEDAAEKQKEAEQDKEKQILEYEQKIIECEQDINRNATQIVQAKERVKELKDVLGGIKLMAKSDASLTQCYNILSKALEGINVHGLRDFNATSQLYRDTIKEHEAKLESYTRSLEEDRGKIESLKKLLKETEETLKSHKSRSEEWDNGEKGALLNEYSAKIKELSIFLNDTEVQLLAMEKKDESLKGAIAVANKMIAGAVTCPKCHHTFIVTDDASVEDYKRKVEELQKDVNRNREEYHQLADKFDVAEDDCNDYKKRSEKLVKERERLKEEVERFQGLIFEAKSSISNYERGALSKEGMVSKAKLDIDYLIGQIELLRSTMFNEAECLLEGRIKQGEDFIKQTEDKITFMMGMRTTYQNNLEGLRTHSIVDFSAQIQQQLETTLAEQKEVSQELDKCNAELDTLKAQEVNFTLFKSYLARKKIDAFSLIVNDFLEKIGSDIRLRLEGFSVTKTGKLRDKISVNVMRDGVDCGSYQKFSGGEKARLNLACILSLHTLTNSNCEDGRGLDFLIIDELLDKSDEVGMATYCEALNKLRQTALLITQGAVAEGYPHKLLITKSKGISTISY